MRQFGLVFTYSFLERLRSKAFKNTTIIIIILLACLILLPKYLGSGGESIDGEIVVLNTTGMEVSADGFKKNVSKSYHWRLIQTSDLEKEQKRLEAQDDILGIVSLEEREGKPILVLTVNKMDDASYTSQLHTYVQNLYTMSEMNKLVLSPTEKARLTASVQVEVKELVADSKSITTTYWPIYLITFMLYLLIYMFGGNVATSVSVEKSSRVKEILITKVKPEQLLFGKVLGVGLAGLLQFLIIIGSGYLLMKLTESGSALDLFGMKIDFSILDSKIICLLAIFFILGYFFYAALFAAAGSLVSRSEEVNQATLPISILMMAGLVISFVAMIHPDGTLAVVGSYIPFITPFAMFVRVGMSNSSVMEILVPTLILLISTIGVCWLSAKIYQVGVLLYGQKPSPKLIYKAIRSL